MSSLWLLQSLGQNGGSNTAGSFWLKPGSALVGRQGAIDAIVGSDKSISRKHAVLTVPTLDEWAPNGSPYVNVKDNASKYGTFFMLPGAVTEARLENEAKLRHGTNLRLGYIARFQLVNQDWRVFLPPQQLAAVQADAAEQARAAAADLGLPLTDRLQEDGVGHVGTRFVSLVPGSFKADGAVVLAMLQGQMLVDADWLQAWRAHNVWATGEAPAEADYPVQVHYFSPSGSRKALGSSSALLDAQQARLLEGRMLCWSRGTAGDPFLRAAAELLGASSMDVPSSAPHAMPAPGSVVVRASEDEHLPAAYARLPWTTPDRLVGGLLEGSLEGVVQQPAATPSSAAKGRRDSKAGAKKMPATGTKRRRAAVMPQQEGSDTEASDCAVPEQELAMQAAPEPSIDCGVTAGRKRRCNQQEQQQQQQQEAEEQQAEQTPAKRQRRGRTKTTAAAAPSLLPAGEVAASLTPVAADSIMPGPPPQASAHKPLPELPASEGWHTIKHGRAARAAAATATSPPLPPKGREDGTGATKAGVRGNGNARVQLVEEGAEQIETFDCNLVVVTNAPRPPPPRAPSSSGDVPNYKAFRPKGVGGAPLLTPVELVLLTEIYEEAVDGGSVDREEKERRAELSEADKLFAADLKATKATLRVALGNKSGLRKGRAKDSGGGRAKITATPPAGQRSILGFMGTKGRGKKK